MALADYYRLTKPGIVYGNTLAAAAGFLFASRWSFSPTTFLGTMLGLALVVAAACVMNNVYDADLDQKMRRTKRRVAILQNIGRPAAKDLALVLGAGGLALLLLTANWLSAAAAALGMIGYLWLYTPAKRLTPYATLIGSVAGAMPPVVGYSAAAGRLDGAALLLFLIMATWQMPHFYAISIFRAQEYRSAGLPVLPLVKGVTAAKRQMVVWAAAFAAMAASPFFFGLAGPIYFIAVLSLSVWWFRIVWSGLYSLSDARWARRVFKASLIVLLGTNLALALSPLL